MPPPELTWARVRELAPFVDLSPGVRKKAEAEAERLAEWFGLAPDLHWTRPR